MQNSQRAVRSTLVGAQEFIDDHPAEVRGIASNGVRKNLDAIGSALTAHLSAQSVHKMSAQTFTRSATEAQRALVQDHLGTVAPVARVRRRRARRRFHHPFPQHAGAHRAPQRGPFIIYGMEGPHGPAASEAGSRRHYSLNFPRSAGRRRGGVVLPSVLIHNHLRTAGKASAALSHVSDSVLRHSGRSQMLVSQFTILAVRR